MLIDALYRKTQNVAQIGDKFKTECGVRPRGLLFITFMDKVARLQKQQYNGTPLGYRKLQPVYFDEYLYADDVKLFPNIEKEIEKKVEVWAIALKHHALKINFRKTELMNVGRAITCEN